MAQCRGAKFVLQDRPVLEEGYTTHLSFEATILGICVIVYTFFSACAAFYTALLYHFNGQIVVSISLIALCAGLQCLVTMTQAILAENIWCKLMIDDYNFALTQWRNPYASIAHHASRPTLYPEVQAMLAVRIVGVYLFNVESLLFFFWTWTLFCSVCNIKFPGLISGRFHRITKVLGLVLPALQVAVINIPQVMATTVPMMVLYNFFLVIPLTAGILMLLVILYKFARVRWNASWSVTTWQKTMRIWQMWDRGQGQSSDNNIVNPLNSGNTVPLASSSAQSPPVPRRPCGTATNKHRKDQDRYLLLRFCLCFVWVSLFQISFIYSQIVEYQSQWLRKQPWAPKPPYGWTKHQQLTDWSFFFAGSSVGYFVYLLYGTTQECGKTRRRLLDNTRQWWKKIWARKKKKREEGQNSLDQDSRKDRLPRYKDRCSPPVDPSPAIDMEVLRRPESAHLVAETWSPLYHSGQHPAPSGHTHQSHARGDYS